MPGRFASWHFDVCCLDAGFVGVGGLVAACFNAGAVCSVVVSAGFHGFGCGLGVMCGGATFGWDTDGEQRSACDQQ